MQNEQTRATTAEQERSALIQTLVTTLSNGSRKGKGKRYKGQNHMSNVKCWNCGKSGHCWRDCREMWWSEEKATGKGRSNSAESSNWEEGRLGGRSQSYREQDEKWTDSLKLRERFHVREAKEQRVRRWKRPREETVSVRTREEGARARGRVRGESEQLKDDEKKGKHPGNGTQDP